MHSKFFFDYLLKDRIENETLSDQFILTRFISDSSKSFENGSNRTQYGCVNLSLQNLIEFFFLFILFLFILFFAG
jgi:hypothetical protein